MAIAYGSKTKTSELAACVYSIDGFSIYQWVSMVPGQFPACKFAHVRKRSRSRGADGQSELQSNGLSA